jgi:murein DD-endopeptidase MepM/ murein hydrolase activator NlpD
MIIRFCIVFFLFSTTAAYCDIYSYVNDDGVECYTDIPSRKDAVLIMKTPSASRKYSFDRSTGSRRPTTGNSTIHTTLTHNEVAIASGSTCNLPVRGRITSPVGLRSDPIDGLPRFHNGVDIAIPEGTPVRPVAAGTVVYSGWRGGYGNAIIVEHADSMTTIYAHNKFNLSTIGEHVDSDTTIAYSGSTGRSTGPHLHFEAWRDGVNVTSTFVGYGGAEQTGPAVQQVALRQNPVRTAILPDGSVLFTNLPYTHP